MPGKMNPALEVKEEKEEREQEEEEVDLVQQCLLEFLSLLGQRLGNGGP
jgi:hypothetical protein